MVSNHTDGVMKLVRQTAEGLADLVGQHLKLARLELAQDLVSVARRARLITGFLLLAIVGYALAMAGAAVCLGGNQQMGLAFVLVGLVHLGVGGLGMRLAALRTRGAPLMNSTAGEMKRSFATLGSAGAATGLEHHRAL